MIQEKKIIFFDGVCNLCNSSVDFVMKRDSAHQFFFASLQGETAKKYLSKTELSSLRTIIYYDHGHKYFESTAALKIAKELPTPWSLLSGFLIIPRLFRDPIYNFISINRYRWFGKLDICRLPSEEESLYFFK
jgi:predicted DCC family thiol-disulfide oxidoreductase YuxK